jgi:hypothetical protein
VPKVANVNDKRGEVAIELDGKDYVLRFSLGATRALEKKFKSSVPKYLASKGDDVKSEDIVALFDAGIKGVTEDELYEMMDWAHMKYYVEKLLEAMGAGPDVKDDKAVKEAAVESPLTVEQTATTGMN